MADLIENLITERIGQLTGSRGPQGRLLMNVTDPWTVLGVDLGANTEHNDRLYFFFGDVATSDNGEHRCEGWTFFLPNDHQGATERTGQPDWRFCSRCHNLFWAPKGNTTGTVCPQGGEHYFHPDSWNFALPNDHQGATDATGQRGWRFCGKCRSMAWFPNGHAPGSCCPGGNPRNSDLIAWTDDVAVSPATSIGHRDSGWNFMLPNDHQGARDVVDVFHSAAQLHGLPASLLSDNGAVFNATPRKGKVLLQTELERLGIASKNSRPYHPQTCGKVERLHQTLKRYLAKQTLAGTIAELQGQLDTFRHYYNDIRPHRALHGRTPLQAYSARVKAKPASGPRPATHFRVPHDKVDGGGTVTLRPMSKLHHIGLGRAHKGLHASSSSPIKASV